MMLPTQIFRPQRSAFALSIVLWIVAALLAGIAFFSAIAKDNILITKGIDSKLQSELTAESILELLKYYITTASYDDRALHNTYRDTQYTLPPKIILDGREYTVTKNIKISLHDTSSMLNAFYPREEMMGYLIGGKQHRQRFYTITDALKDWKDSDNIVSLNGAEEAYYKLYKGANFGPRNSPALQGIGELRLVKGIDIVPLEQWRRVKKYLYYGSSNPNINLSLIDTTILQYLFHLNTFESDRLDKLRMQQPVKFKYEMRNNPLFDEYLMGFSLSMNIMIRIEVDFQDARTILETLIQFHLDDPAQEWITESYRIF